MCKISFISFIPPASSQKFNQNSPSVLNFSSLVVANLFSFRDNLGGFFNYGGNQLEWSLYSVFCIPRLFSDLEGLFVQFISV